MKNSTFSYNEFEKLLKIVKHQFLFKTEKSLYYIHPVNYNTYNSSGFVAHNELTRKVEIIRYEGVIEVVVDSVKYNYSGV
jgi:hypothetical protein